jgi:hypothetical protein
VRGQAVAPWTFPTMYVARRSCVRPRAGSVSAGYYTLGCNVQVSKNTRMATRARPVESLTPADFLKHRVWEFLSNDEPDETYVNPVERLPVSSLERRIVGVEVQLASGRGVWAFLGNVDVNDARRTHHFLTISVLAQDEWFHLARYHDVDREERGPARLAAALGLGVNEVFPIRYDIGSWVADAADSLLGEIDAEPRGQLSRTELINLAVP